MTAPLAFRLLGHGIAYSVSPAMQNAAFTVLGLPHRYAIADVAPEEVDAAVAALREPGIGGANVTTPHKLAVAERCDELSADAALLGSVNCVVPHDGRLTGHNTDLPAIVDELRALRPDGVGRAVLLGGGGAGRAVVEALARAGATEIITLQRRDGSWARLGDELATADLVVNATPVGTGSDESPVPVELLRPGLAVFDLVYRPSPTRLVRDARAAGAPARSGAGMLLGQGWRSLELWLGVAAPVDVMREALRDALGGTADV
ncbi:MAG: shikimate dehydrogenase [Chloroflexota bacterium]